MTRNQKKEWALAFGGATLAILGVLLGVFFTGCRTTSGPATEVGPGLGPKIISCASEIVRRDWSRVYPAVLRCLTAPIAEPMACLDAIPAVVDVVGCIVQNVGRSVAGQTTEPEVDVVTLRKSERARAFIESRGLKFTEE